MNNKKRPTIATVAHYANLSVATVDRVLNARAPVNPQTADKVHEAAEAVGYFRRAIDLATDQRKEAGLPFRLSVAGHLSDVLQDLERCHRRAGA
jgi:DNA-binding LacI/PurR family transcriptional regulator